MVNCMRGVMRTLPLVLAAAVLTALTSACSGGGGSVAPLPQNASNNTGQTEFPAGTVALSSADIAAKATYTNFRYHITLVGKPGMIHPMSVIFPMDMTNGGGAVLKATKQHDIFVNATSAQVGTPTTFQTNLNASTFISVLNQYDGVTSAGKFPVGTSFSAAVPTFSNMISQGDLLNVIHAAAKNASGGSGYGHEYNVFLKSGLDTCFDFGPCYSPDNPPSWVFCAYHSSVDFSDLTPTHVVFTVIPYQEVAGCGDVGLPEPNPAPIDSTATALSHEFSESVSDADPNTGWFNATFGMEIGDVCNNLRATETLNAHKYLIQMEYSNSVHGCFF